MDTSLFYNNTGVILIRRHPTNQNTLEPLSGCISTQSCKNGWWMAITLLWAWMQMRTSGTWTSYLSSKNLKWQNLYSWNTAAALPTYNQGSYPIGGLFTTRVLQNTQCNYLSSLDMIGDHQCLQVDLPKYQTFGTNMPPVVSPKERHPNRRSSDSQKIPGPLLGTYCKTWPPHKNPKLLDQLTGKHDLTDSIQQPLDISNTIRIQGMLTVEQQCWKLHTLPYGWTTPITNSFKK